MIHIAASSDNNYAQHVGVMMQSLLSNTSTPEQVQIHLISNEISDNNLQKLSLCADKFSASLNIIPANNQQYDNLPTLRYGTSAYQRISLGDYLPSTAHKAIYLDCDILVLGDIKGLWDTPLDNNPLAAVENLSPKACQSLDFARNDYFNSGVLVADLQWWRNNDIYTDAVSFITEHADRLKYIDQCTLNNIFKKKWKRLDLSWNQQADIYGVLKKYSDGCGYSKADIKKAIKQPNIVHFIGTQKPWLLNCFHPHKNLYWHYLAQTPWAGAKYSDDSTSNRIKYFFSFRKRIKQAKRKKLTLL
ncbi:MAG: glycosyltransferase family 8 protein [Cellvibrionaceae bacterium]